MAYLPEAEASEAEVGESGREWWKVRPERQAEALSGCLPVQGRGSTWIDMSILAFLLVGSLSPWTDASIKWTSI